ncbi:AsmA family protein [Vibrio sp. 10N.261.46.E12]|uniref:AsmA family protein n=1 Tax=unclassified Vibrio TaxID=2614977 RepID=UPI0009760EDC|nr:MULTISPECIES: AsmA family protein [unclassified Vibrio]OMO32753.1 cell envelope biogenesis protein AsmA [Vibrio sp. 10N.261.45.E1]PMJ27123.1 cell envelope biogenesis protein AsmA [Vibrio sp. 10N.286.45.B6]PML87818.1 cell envelope biogenesis protein AsmA [Vibrio sp. 10N.261.49.E11]PMM73114.1 cell envelope biogenesis protein AsmA [Vibrio sp. 10N.261.46.F12]PMM82165.1 cell envelope biogenesis protein AsmA [Vibrio sp. 10N.261.46.E8]
MKKLLIFIAVPVFVVVAAILALVLLVNPNQFKPLIVEQAQKHTGLELVIEGDISWQFFPSIGFELGQTELRNPEGFTQPNLFKVDTVGVDVSVTPLFSNQLEIGNITLDGAEFYLETLKDGRKNIDALTQASVPQESEPVADTNAESTPASQEQSATEASGWTINLAGVTVSNALFEMDDKQAGSFTKLYDVSLNLSEFAVDTWTTATFAASGENNQQKFSANGSAEFKLAEGFASYALRNIDLNAKFNDPATSIESAKIGLNTFEFDKVNLLTYAVIGKAAGLDLDLKGSGELTVDSAISKVTLNKLTLDSTFKGDTLPQSPMKVDMLSDLSFDLTKNHLSFVLEKLQANSIALDGKADVTLSEIPKVRFSLHSPNIDLDEFLGLGNTTETASTAPSGSAGGSTSNSGSSAPAKEVEPDLSALKTLDVKGDITIDKFKANNAKMQNVKTAFSVNRGVAELTSFTSNLYQGSISATAKLDARKTPATYTAKKKIKGVKVQPLLVDVANNDMLEGTGNIDVNVKGKSLTPTGIKKNLVGTIAINFEDGAVNGINVAQLIRENYAKIKGEKIESKDEAQKTDFSAMKATLKVDKGWVSTNDLSAQSPLLRVTGQGKANFINETVDFLVRTSIVGSLEGQGGKSIDDLKDVTIPIKVTGQWADPKFALVFDDVLKQKAQKEIDRGLEKLDEKYGDKIKDEKTRDAVNGLLKGLFN